MRSLLRVFTTFLMIFIAVPAFAQRDLGIRGPIGQVDPNAPVGPTASREYFNQCMNHLPRGFTPSTRDEFCTCSSVAITQAMTHRELELALGERQKDNAPYEASIIKFAEAVVTPCMNAPIRTLSYISCLEERSQDRRIRSFPAYCTCVGDFAAARLGQQGATDMIRHYVSFERNEDYRLVESFVNAPPFRGYMLNGMRACIQPAFMTR